MHFNLADLLRGFILSLPEMYVLVDGHVSIGFRLCSDFVSQENVENQNSTNYMLVCIDFSQNSPNKV